MAGCGRLLSVDYGSWQRNYVIRCPEIMCQIIRDFGYPEKVVGFGFNELRPATVFSGNSGIRKKLWVLGLTNSGLQLCSPEILVGSTITTPCSASLPA